MHAILEGRRRLALLSAVILAAMTLVAFGPASPAHADPGCQTNGVLEIFARKSGASLYPISDEAQAFFNDVGLALGNISHDQVQLGDEDGDYGKLQSGEYPAAGGDDLRAELYSWLVSPGYVSSVNTGTNELVGYLNQRAARCPNEATVLGGDSQGSDVIGSALQRQGGSGLSDIAKSHIAYVALYGDPRYAGYLTGSTNPPPGIPTCLHGPWLRGNLQCGPSQINGLLTARIPYVPSDFMFRTGSWCDAGDGMCTGSWVSCATGCGTHNTAYAGPGGWISQSASIIADAARSRLSWMTYQPFPYNQLLPTMDAATLTLLSTLSSGVGSATANGNFVSYHGAVYRIAGGAPLYVSGSDASYPDMAGWSGATPITDDQWDSLRPLPADGTYISDVATGAVYITAGGAPMYISGNDAPQLPNWTTALKVPHWDLVNWQHLHQFPADGYFLTDAQTGMVYETAGGAPLYVSSSDAPLLPQWQYATPVPHGEFVNRQHLRTFPADGTYMMDVQTGMAYITLGGAPMYISGDDAPFMPQWMGATRVPHWEFQSWTNLRQYPADGYYLRDIQTGMVYVTAGGAPLYVSAQDGALLPQWQYASPVPHWELQNWTHLRPYPADGVFISDIQTGRVYETAGGAPLYVSGSDASALPGWMGATIVGHWEFTAYQHLRQYPADNTYLSDVVTGKVYVTAGGAPLYISSGNAMHFPNWTNAVRVPGWDFVNHTDLRTAPADGTYVQGLPSGEVFQVTSGMATRVITTPLPAAMAVDDWAIVNQLGGTL